MIGTSLATSKRFYAYTGYRPPHFIPFNSDDTLTTDTAHRSPRALPPPLSLVLALV